MDPPTWTGTWMDPRFSPPADGGRPQNALTGTLYKVSAFQFDSIAVPQEDGRMRFWRNTSVASLWAGQTATLAQGTLGFEWDIDADNGFRPAGLIDLSRTTRAVSTCIVDQSDDEGNCVATHRMTLYRYSSGALVFSAGTVDYSWGLDNNHDSLGPPPGGPDPNMQQSTVNLLADMGAQPATLQGGLLPATASAD
jgi:hypothetical protein